MKKNVVLMLLYVVANVLHCGILKAEQTIRFTKVGPFNNGYGSFDLDLTYHGRGTPRTIKIINNTGYEVSVTYTLSCTVTNGGSHQSSNGGTVLVGRGETISVVVWPTATYFMSASGDWNSDAPCVSSPITIKRELLTHKVELPDPNQSDSQKKEFYSKDSTWEITSTKLSNGMFSGFQAKQVE